MNKVKISLLIFLIILGVNCADIKAGEPVTGLLICCRGTDMGPFLVNGKWDPKHDYGDINVVRGILQNIKDAGINIVCIDMTNPSQWTKLWDEFRPMVENIRTVCAEKKMEYFIMIGAVVSDDVRNGKGMPDYIKTVGNLEFWNNQAKYIWENWATDSHYRTYGFGDDRKMINMFYPGELVDALWNTAPDAHKTYLSKFYRGTHEYNQDFKDTPTDGWGYRDKQQNSDGKIRFVSPTAGLHPGSSTYISQQQWKERVNWAAEAEHYSIYGSYDDTCDNINWGIHETKNVTNPNRKYANDDPYVYYNVVKDKLNAKDKIKICADISNPKIQFCITEIEKSIQSQNLTLEITDSKHATVEFIIKSDYIAKQNPKYAFPLRAEGFSLQKDAHAKIWVIAADTSGLMYGGLELAEQIRLYGINKIAETDQNPQMEVRGVKFNIPLDVRSPTYTSICDATQTNLPVMWEFDFWVKFIDNLACARYNMISLWNLQPFPSMVKTPGYPDIALDDVRRTTATLTKEHYELGNGEKIPQILASTEVIIKMTIDEKILFWQKVMRYAKSRNVRFYLMTWNVFDFGIEGKYGITEKIDNPVTQDYFGKSIKQMFITYPDLEAIGLTVGENMINEPSEKKERWAFDTYGLGLVDAANTFPNRKFAFIHRMHQGEVEHIKQQFAPVINTKNIEFLFSFKYAQAHVMSSTTPTFHKKYVKEIEGMKTLWTLRNDDNFIFRWGAPDFVREFIKNIPIDVSKGYYYGSDGYVWGREFLSKQPETPRQLEVDKHWFHWMLFGRLGYNPDISNARFEAILHERFPETDGKKLLTAWQSASMIYPITTGFHWGAADFSWYIEGCRSHKIATKIKNGFHSVNQFIIQETHSGTNNQSIPNYVKCVVEKTPSTLTSPLQVANQLHAKADSALMLIQSIHPKNNNELSNVLSDITSIAYLGKYYACKINGATHLALYRETKEKASQTTAIDELTKALKYWELFTQNAMKQYNNPVWLNRVGHVDWVKSTIDVKNDIEIAKADISTERK